MNITIRPIRPLAIMVGILAIALCLMASCGTTATADDIRQTSPHWKTFSADDLAELLESTGPTPAQAWVNFKSTHTWNGNTPAPPPLPPNASYGDAALNLFNGGTGVWFDANYNSVSTAAAATYAAWDL